MIEMSQIAGLACVFMRMTGCILFNPILGRRNFPAMFQVGLTLALSLLIVTYSEVTVSMDGAFLELCFLLFREFFIGFTMGVVVSLFTYIVIIAGEFIDLQIGMSMSKMYDPQSGVQMSVTSTFLNLIFLFVFFGINGHLTLIHLFINSAELLPYGQVSFINPDLSMKVLDVFCQCTILGLKMSMPIVGIEFLLEMGVGILMKAIPQINVFVINFQAKILVGLLMLLLVFSPITGYIEEVVTLLFNTLAEILVILQAA